MPSQEPVNGDQSTVQEPAFVYPPKFERPAQSMNVWLRSFISLALYLVLGYYIFKQWEWLLLITAIVVFHELGHFFAMKFYRYNDLGIFFIPLLGAYVSGSKREVSQKESAVILLAGPLPGIILGIVFILISRSNPSAALLGVHLSDIAPLLILLNLINLLPIYPLDGGQLLQRIYLDEESWIGKVFVIISAALLCWIAWRLYDYTGHKFYFALLIFPVMMLLRLRTDKSVESIERRTEAEGINLDVSYKDLPDGDYWKIRNILIEQHPSFRDITPTPPYHYHMKEEKVMSAIQNLLHRHLIQDISIAGKIFILLLWIAAFATPWLLATDMSLFTRLGF